MNKTKIKILAVLSALTIGFSATGCADTSWAVKDGSVTLPSGVYLYYLLVNADSVHSQASAASTSSKGKTSSPDVWAQKIGGKDAVAYAKDSAMEECKELVTVEKLAAQRKVTLSAADQKSASSTASSSYSQYASMFNKNGISEASMGRIYKDAYLESTLFKSYYGKGGDKEVSDTELANYYTQNYVHVKQIFVSKYDLSSSSYKAYSGAKLDAQKNKANEAYKAASADIANFSKYVDKYNEDTGMKKNPDGYILSKASATQQNFDQKFTDLAFSLKVGQVGMAESSMGWFIEYKDKTDPTASTFDAAKKQEILQAMKGTEFSNLMKDDVKKESFTVNDSLMNKYDPKKLDLTTAS